MSNELLEQIQNQACYGRAIVFGLVCYLIGVVFLIVAITLYFRESARAALAGLAFVTRDKDSIWIALILILGLGCAVFVVAFDAGICVIV